MNRTISALFFLLLLALPLTAQTLQDEVADVVITEMESIAQTVIQQSFSPPSDLEQGERIWTFTPGYFSIRDFEGDLDISGLPLDGIALGGGVVHGLSGPWMIYGIYGGLMVRGDITAQTISGFPELELSISQDYHSLLFGAGYDLIRSDIISLPLYLGVQGEYYNFNWNSSNVSSVDIPSLEGKMQAQGQGFLWGISGGAAVVVNWKSFSLTPYGLFLYNFNEAQAEISAQYSGWGIPGDVEQTLDIAPYRSATMGLDFLHSEVPDRSISVCPL